LTWIDTISGYWLGRRLCRQSIGGNGPSPLEAAFLGGGGLTRLRHRPTCDA
jgi:hypothetical protein